MHINLLVRFSSVTKLNGSPHRRIWSTATGGCSKGGKSCWAIERKSDNIWAGKEKGKGVYVKEKAGGGGANGNKERQNYVGGWKHIKS